MSPKREQTLAHFEAIVATQKDVEIKGAKSSYTSMNGHMYSFITQEGGFALRMGKEDREAFLKKHKAKTVEQYGFQMREYVAVPPALMKKTKEMAKYFSLSMAYIASLKPKPTTKKKKAKATKKKSAKKKSVTKKKSAKKVTKKSSAKKATGASSKKSAKKATKKTATKKKASKKSTRRKSK